MILPHYSIFEELNSENATRKKIAMALTVATIFFNPIPSFNQAMVGIGKGILLSTSCLLGELALSAYYLSRETTTVPEDISFSDQSSFKLDAPEFSSLLYENLDSIFKAPIDEECISRGLKLPLIKMTLMAMDFSKNNSWYYAILSSALIFALEHEADERSQLSAFMGGLEYGFLREKYGLLSSIAAHFTNNFLTSSLCVVAEYFYNKNQQIKAVFEHYEPYVVTEKVIDQDFKSEETYQLYNDNLKLEYENQQLNKIVKGNYVDNLSLIFSSRQNTYKQLKNQHNQLLHDNEKLRKDAQAELSKSYIYRLFFHKGNNEAKDIITQYVSKHSPV